MGLKTRSFLKIEDREMSAFLLDKLETKRYEKMYESGNSYQYPNENIVRITKWFFKSNEGRLLDYGFGPGENLLHFLKTGYSVSGIEVSVNAKKIVEKKLQGYPQFKDRVELKILRFKDKYLPWPDNYFDYIVANQVLYFLVSERKIINLLKELYRILKPQGKIIVSMMSKFNTASNKDRELSPSVYEYVHPHIPEARPSRVYVIENKKQARRLFNIFKIQEIGYFDNNYCKVCGHHYVIFGSKNNFKEP